MLDIEWSTILWEVINFAVITVVLYFLVFKPMTKRAEQRAIEKADAKASLERDRDLAAEKLIEIDDRLINLDEEIQAISDSAYENSQVLQQSLLEATRLEAEQIMQNAVHEARKEQFIDIKKNQAMLVDTVLGIVGQTLQNVTPSQVHDSLLEDLSAKIWGLGKQDMRIVQNIRESLAERAPVVEVEVARELSDEQEMKLYNTFNALTDDDVEMQVKVVPELIAGIQARIGDLVLDNSLLAQVEATRDEVDKKLEVIAAPEND